MIQMWHRRIIACTAGACIAALLLGLALGVERARANPFPKADTSLTPYGLQTSSPSSVPTAITQSASPTTHSPPPPAIRGGTSPIPGDWSQLLPTLIATFLGAGLALVAAIWLARADERRSTARQERAKVAHYRQLLESVAREIAWNRQEISEALLDIKSSIFTDHAPVLDIWNSNGQEIVQHNSRASAEVAEAYALLRRFARLLDQYRAEVSRGGTEARDARLETLPKVDALGYEVNLALEAASKCISNELS
jgi:hypothetical protein